MTTRESAIRIECRERDIIWFGHNIDTTKSWLIQSVPFGRGAPSRLSGDGQAALTELRTRHRTVAADA
jgi:hypothetical protein